MHDRSSEYGRFIECSQELWKCFIQIIPFPFPTEENKTAFETIHHVPLLQYISSFNAAFGCDRKANVDR